MGFPKPIYTQRSKIVPSIKLCHRNFTDVIISKKETPHFLKIETSHFLKIEIPHFLKIETPHFLKIETPHFPKISAVDIFFN
jgi:hypothetical protein